MPIRMKEWGMKSYPAQGVQVPLSGISGMGETAHAFGRSLAAVGAGVQEMMRMHERVVAKGENAALQDGLQQVVQQAQQQMLNGETVPNWEESWQQTVSPMVEPLLEKIPESRREEALRVAQETLQRASLDTQRQYEVGRLNKARRQWESRVETAVKAGQEKEAISRLEEGRDVFVPEGEMEARRSKVQSLSRAESWRARLQQDPLAALTAWRSGEGERPEEEADEQAVASEMAAAHGALRRRLGAEYAQSVMQGVPPSEASVAGAVSAGLWEPEDTGALHRLTAQEELDWMHRAEECGDDEDAHAALQLRLATLPAPLPQRRRLMTYLETNRALPSEPRRALQTELWNLYRNGAFGCVGDAVPQQRMARLMQEGNRLLAEGDAKGTAAWLNVLRRTEKTWLCFEA